MNRKELLNLGFIRREELALSTHEYLKWVRRFTFDVLEQDLGNGDITTTAIIGEKTNRAKALIRANREGVIAGIEEVSWFYEQMGLEVYSQKRDGDLVKSNEILLEVLGSEKGLLQIERTGLKVLQRMSGIATLTRECINNIRKLGYKTMIVATRKTHWPLLDKKAVMVGGGGSHRLGLWDSILIKNNHLEVLKKLGYKRCIEEALERVWNYTNKVRFIEVEVENKSDAIKAARKFKQLQQQSVEKPCIIMLDNTSPKQIKAVITELKELDLYNSVLLEASGGINQSNIIEYAETGVDVISLGFLTHSPKALDINQILTYKLLN